MYSVNTLVVCDDNRKIRHLATGWVGSANDIRVLPECGMALHTERYFSGDEYVMGDTGYKQYKYLLVVKRKPRTTNLTPDDEKFNKFIAMMRVKIEHVFGILKSRFKSLKGIPIRIKGPKDLHLVNCWTLVSVILNDFLLDQNDD